MRWRAVRLWTSVREVKAAGAHPYRGARIVEERVLSGRAMTFGVVAAFVFSALVVPFAVHLPRWVELETVLLAWWAVWAVVLSALGMKGGLKDDHDLVLRFPSFGERRVPRERLGPRSFWWWVGEAFSFATELEALVFLVLLFAALAVLLVGVWLVVELAAPALFFITYLGLVRALRHVRPRAPGPAIAAGTLWATVYVAPLAALVWGLHVVLR